MTASKEEELAAIRRELKELLVSMPTFVFAFLGESAYQSDEFAGLEVLNMFHLPRIPPSPGLGIFFSQYRKKLAMLIANFSALSLGLHG